MKRDLVASVMIRLDGLYVCLRIDLPCFWLLAYSQNSTNAMNTKNTLFVGWED